MSKAARKFFTNPSYSDYWSNRIRSEHYEEAYRNKFLQELKVRDDDLILEVGVGEGRNASALLAQGATYVGIDISEAMLRKAREGLPLNRVEKVDLIVGDALSLPFRKHSFSKSLCMATIFFVPDQAKAINEILSASRSRAGIEFRNSRNPRIFLYARTVEAVNLLMPLIRRMLRTKTFPKALASMLGKTRAEKFSHQLLEYDAMQPVFGITANKIRMETQKSGWSIESLEGYKMMEIGDNRTNPASDKTGSVSFDPVILAHLVKESEDSASNPSYRSTQEPIRNAS